MVDAGDLKSVNPFVSSSVKTPTIRFVPTNIRIFESALRFEQKLIFAHLLPTNQITSTQRGHSGHCSGFICVSILNGPRAYVRVAEW